MCSFKSIKHILACTALLYFCSTPPTFASPRFNRGVGIFKMMNWAEIEPAPSKQFVRPAFSQARFSVTDEEMANLKSAGFDFVRLAIDPGPFLQFDGSDRDDLDTILLRNVRRFLKFGLNVIVDFHPSPQHTDYLPDNLIRSLDDPLFLRYVETIRRTARLLGTPEFTDSVALELMNEPSLGFRYSSFRLWEQFQDKLFRAARNESSDLELIVTGGQFGTHEGLIKLDPAGLNDGKTIFTFHYYLPLVFTHQGVSNDISCECFNGLPFPSTQGTFDKLWPGIADRLRVLASKGSEKLPNPAAAEKMLRNYLRNPFDEHDIDRHFNAVLAWANSNNINPIRILLGEFGVSRTYDQNKGAKDQDAKRWLGQVRRAAELRKFPWAVWEYKGNGGMSIMTDGNSSEIYPPVAEALNLGRGSPRP